MPAPGTPALRRALPDLAAAVALAGLALLLYGRAAGLGGPGFWWSDDDFFDLRFVASYGPREIALDPAVWQRLPFRMLTPLLFLSLQLDAALFGLDPAAFYLHQLAALALAVAALHLVLRLWLSLPWAAAGAALFLLGPPVASLAPLLAVRHYVEALLLGVLAAGAFALAVRRRSTGWALLSAALGFAAMLAKEIAVPLPALLVLLPVGGARGRLRAALPHAAALVLYLIYRLWMLDTLVGGYGWAVLPGAWPALVLSLPGRIAAEIAGAGGLESQGGRASWALLAVALLGLGLAVAGSRRAAGLAAAALCLSLLPVLPVSQEMAPRYAVPAWLVLAVALAAGGSRLAGSGADPDGEKASGWGKSGRRRVAAVTLAAAAFACAWSANRAVWAGEAARAERKAAENRFALQMGAGDLLRQPLNPPAALRELGWLRKARLGSPPAGGWFYDDLYLSTPAAAGRRVWGWDPAQGRVIDLTGEVPALRARHRAAQRPAAPLAADFWSTGGIVSWELGPYPHGRYALVFGDGSEVVEVPRRGGFQRRVRTTALRVRYTAPEGWATCSPELLLDFARTPEVRWSRATALRATPRPPPSAPRAPGRRFPAPG